ncbi:MULTISPECIES: tellurite resistance/C4-dicarboxylate transporter family protein [unclassified Desulfovibrio]|uniref:tellurite resistance/C4-dicarboxylate transporter family protein n=1 Tax=unclassified Desulfovibrio TaxID=2593640 RepID=UPI0013ED13DA|nr:MULTISPECIES: tellurite resistance/C4-dicarboxylate transporter family protein [unclassified Desulfovibrio]
MNSVGSRFFALVKGMAPANFAMVMSTGILSLALLRLGCPSGARLLHGVNACLYVALWALLLLRLLRSPGAVAADFTSHLRGPGFLTIVAATAIFGTQSVVLARDPAAGARLFCLGALCWAIILWGVFSAIFTRAAKPPLACGVNGTWLLATVSTESLVILGAALGAPQGWDADSVYFCLCALFLVGVILYIFVIVGIFLRFCFTDMTAGDSEPTYWINASAAASTALAGTALMGRAGAAPLLALLQPYISGITLLAWATASWWVPMLALLGLWRHCVKGYPYAYTPTYWSMVFPLGMYTVCTAAVSDAYGVPALMAVPRGFIFLALGAWCLTLAGLILSRGRILLMGPAPAPQGVCSVEKAPPPAHDADNGAVKPGMR